MAKKNGYFDFSLMAKVQNLEDEEFRVLYFINNTIAFKGGGKQKIYRELLADLCNKSVRTISRITKKLSEKGVILKEVRREGQNTYDYYSIPSTKHNNFDATNGTKHNKFDATNDTKHDKFDVTDDRLNNTNNTKNTNNTNNTNNTKQKDAFDEILEEFEAEKVVVEVK